MTAHPRDAKTSSYRVMIRGMNRFIRERLPLQTHPETFQIIEHRNHSSPKVFLVAVRQAVLRGALNCLYCMLHRFLMSTFELAMKGEVGDIHLRVADILQLSEARNQVVPHRNRHIFKAEGCAKGLCVVAVAIEPFHSLDVTSSRREHGPRHGVMDIDSC